jgi:hypothetical protein
MCRLAKQQRQFADLQNRKTKLARPSPHPHLRPDIDIALVADAQPSSKKQPKRIATGRKTSL